MIIVAALPSADGTAAAATKRQKQEDGCKEKTDQRVNTNNADLTRSLHISRGTWGMGGAPPPAQIPIFYDE